MARQGVDEDDAWQRVYDNMLPTHRKALANIFVNEMLWFYAMRKDPVFLSVKTTHSAPNCSKASENVLLHDQGKVAIYTTNDLSFLHLTAQARKFWSR